MQNARWAQPSSQFQRQRRSAEIIIGDTFPFVCGSERNQVKHRVLSPTSSCMPYQILAILSFLCGTSGAGLVQLDPRAFPACPPPPPRPPRLTPPPIEHARPATTPHLPLLPLQPEYPLHEIAASLYMTLPFPARSISSPLCASPTFPNRSSPDAQTQDARRIPLVP